MAIEIERKFLVVGDEWRSAPPIYFCQGYLSSHKERTVRVRIADDRGFMTIKGKSTGASRIEFEYDIPVTDAKQLLLLCEYPLIEKYRRKINHAGMDWEIDEFLGDNLGLVVAEVELETEDQPFVKPAWVGQEVTHDARYLNSNLVSHPFKGW